MARNLTSIPDIQAPDADYPVGRIQNEDPPTAGTPIIEELYGDLVQFFHKLMRLAGISHNGLPENETNGFQFITALTSFVRTVTASISQRGVVELADGAETQAGIDTLRAVTPAGLASKVATTTSKGLIELATGAEVISGIDTERAVTPAGLASKVATTTSKGLIELADNAETLAGTDNQRAVTPAGLASKDAGLIKKIINIGDWNMDSVNTKAVSHGLGTNYTEIRSISVIIRNDTNNSYYQLNSVDTSIIIQGGVTHFDSSLIYLYRLTAGIFDDTNFDSTSFNRGWITIEYVA